MVHTALHFTFRGHAKTAAPWWVGASPDVATALANAAAAGYSASHGCIRMRIRESKWLFERVHVGTPVFIVSA